MWNEVVFGIQGVQVAILPLLLVGLAVGAAGMIGSAVKNKEAKDQVKDMQAKQNARQAENKAWYRSSQAEDYLQTAEAQRILKQQRDALDRERRITTSSAAVTGATPGAVAASKAASTRSMATTLSNLAAMGDQVKARKEAQYFAREDSIDNRQSELDRMRVGITQQESQNWSNLSQQGFSVAAGAAGGAGAGAAGAAMSAVGAGAAGAAGLKPGRYGMYHVNYGGEQVLDINKNRK